MGLVLIGLFNGLGWEELCPGCDKRARGSRSSLRNLDRLLRHISIKSAPICKWEVGVDDLIDLSFKYCLAVALYYFPFSVISATY